MKSPLVLVHGWAGSGSAWSPVVSHLDATIWGPIVTFDLPGSPSYVGSAESRISSAAHELVDLLHSFDSPAVLVGHSLGAQVTLLAQSEAPHHVQAEVVIDPAYDADDDERDELSRWADRIERRGHDELLTFFAEALIGVDEPVRSQIMLDLQQTSVAAIVQYLRSEYLDSDSIGLHSATVRAAQARTRPVLAIHSTPRAAERSRLLPSPAGSEVVEWPGYHHFLHLQDPARFASGMASWKPATGERASRVPEYER